MAACSLQPAAAPAPAEQLAKEMEAKASAARASFKRPKRWVLGFGWSLALCAGLVNAVGREAWHGYVSHMTGQTTAIGLDLVSLWAGHPDGSEVLSGTAVLFSFLLGAFACGLLIDKNCVYFGGKAFYGAALVGNGLLLAVSVVLTAQLGLTELPRCLTAAACGLQNAMCTSHFGAIIRTTHVTGTVTDIGSNAGRVVTIFFRHGFRLSHFNELERADVDVDATRLFVLATMLSSFFIGSILGGILHRVMGIHALLVPACFTFTVGSTYAIMKPQLKRHFKKLSQERASRDLDKIRKTLTRTQSSLELRGRMDGGVLAAGKDPVQTMTDLQCQLSFIAQAVWDVEARLQCITSLETVPEERPSGMVASNTV
jgi:uncharacterized membrane protein YoaK (UPF0700 family)